MTIIMWGLSLVAVIAALYWLARPLIEVDRDATAIDFRDESYFKSKWEKDNR